MPSRPPTTTSRSRESGGASGPEIVERGRQAGLALGDDPASYVADLAARVREKLAGFDAAYLLTTIAGGMRLDEYLRTRTFELVVHGLDIGAASGVDPAFAQGPLVDAATLAAEVAALSGRGARSPARRDRTPPAAGGVHRRLSGQVSTRRVRARVGGDGALASP